jgi:protein O-mannosyl-transferase
MKSNRFLLVLAAILITAIVITYSNHFNNGFYFDDVHAIVNNAYIKDIGNIPLFFKDGRTLDSLPSNQTYRPFLVTTFAFDYWLGHGFKPFYFHLTTFILFITQGVLMYFLYAKVYNLSFKHEGNLLAAFFAVAWYMLHPANAETINYILARSDSLSTFFVVLVFVMYIYSPLSRKWHLYLVPLALGIFTKPTAVMFGPLLLIYIIMFEKKISLTEIFKKQYYGHLLSALRIALPSLLACGLFFFITKTMESETWTPGGSSSRLIYLITQPYVLLHYFTTFFLPISLSADTDWKTLSSILDFRFFVGTLFVITLFLTSIYLSKKENLRPISFGILWFFIALIPSSTIIPLAEVMNDHRIFYPYVGLMMSVCWALTLLIYHFKKMFPSDVVINRSIIIILIIILSLYAYGTHQRNNVWGSDESLWHDVTEKSPRNGRGLMNYGLALMAKADFQGAEKYFSKALEFTPQYSYLHINIGILKEATHKPEEAEQYFRKAVSLNPGDPEGYFYYARFLKNQKRMSEALTNLTKVLDLSSAHLLARDMLMDIYYAQSDFHKLHELALKTSQIIPDDQKAIRYLNMLNNNKFKSNLDITIETAEANRTPENLISLSLQYYKAGQFENSIKAAKEALKLKPDYDLAYNNICAAYNELKQWDKAIEAGEKALKLNPQNQLAKNNLAWAKNHKK